MSSKELRRLKVVELIEAKQVTVAAGACCGGPGRHEQGLQPGNARRHDALFQRTFGVPRLEYWDMVWLEK